MKTVFFFLLLGFVILSACEQAPVAENVASACPPDCHGGSSAVATSIDSPTNGGKAYAGERLVVSVGLNDVGESSVEDGLVCITGLNEEVFSGLGGCPCESFYITLENSDDDAFEKTRVEFPSSFVSQEASGGQDLSVYTRYSYSTYGVFDACLTGDPFEETACSVTGDKLSVSSSGPVQVSSIMEDLSLVGSNAVTLRLLVDANLNVKSNDRLVSLEDTSNPECVLHREEGVDYTNVDVSVVLFGEAHECGRMHFEDGKNTASISCKIENIDTSRFIGGQKEYQGWVRLDYGFQTIQSVQFDAVQE